MKSLKNIFEDFFDFGDRYAIDMHDGFHYEGYAFEILEDSFLFLSGGPLATEDPIKIMFENVNLNSLYFVKFTEPRWKKAYWDIDAGRWEITLVE